MSFDLNNPPILDPRNEDQLTQLAKLRAYNLSQGQINSTLEGDPLDVLIRTQAYAGAELLFYANQLPLAFAVRFLLDMTSVERLNGTRATVPVTFTLVSPRSVPFYIPANFEVKGSNRQGTYNFYTTEELIIPVGSISGTVRAAAGGLGEAYNLGQGRINRFTTPLTFLKSVVNLEPAQGGHNGETQASAVSRALARLSSPGLVSKIDYERRAQELMGLGSRAKAMGLLGLDKTSYEKGAVHVFLLSSDGVPANSAKVAEVSALLGEQRHLGTRLYVSPMGTLRISGELIVKLETTANPELVADALWAEFRSILDPTQIEVGAPVQIDEASHRLRFVPGVAYLETLYLNGDTNPVPMPNLYTVPYAFMLTLRMATASGEILTFIRSNGEPLEAIT